MTRPYQICSRCISDTSFPGIRFDAHGVCQYCHAHDALERAFPLGPEGERRLARVVEKIRRSGRRKPYDCIVGVSGGRDSTYLLYRAVQLGLRPLAVHFDNGWDSEIAVRNIKSACSRLNVDLYTHVADWDEFKDLQIAFLKASVPEVEIPTDVAIHGALHEAAVREGVQCIVMGHSFRTEGIAPIEWTYMDGRYIRVIRRRFGAVKQKTVPNFTAWDFFRHTLLNRITVVPLLNYGVYRHDEAQKLLEDKLAWRYYGGHHHECVYTHFVQAGILPKKFNIDKRRLEFSALIRSGQVARQAAVAEMAKTPYDVDGEMIDYCTRKLGLSMDDFQAIMAAPPKSFRDYPTYHGLIQVMKWPLWLAFKLNILSPILYFKFVD